MSTIYAGDVETVCSLLQGCLLHRIPPVCHLFHFYTQLQTYQYCLFYWLIFQAWHSNHPWEWLHLSFGCYP